MSFEQISFLDEQGGSQQRQAQAVDPALAAYLRVLLLREALRLAEHDRLQHDQLTPPKDLDEGLLLAQAARLLGAPSLSSAVRLLAAHLAAASPADPAPASAAPEKARRAASSAPAAPARPDEQRRPGRQPAGAAAVLAQDAAAEHHDPTAQAEQLVLATQAWMETLTAELPSPLAIIRQVEALGAAAETLSGAQEERARATLLQIEQLKAALETIWDVVDGWDGAGFEQIAPLVSLPPKEQEFKALAAAASQPIVRFALALVEHRPGNAGRAEALRKRLGAML